MSDFISWVYENRYYLTVDMAAGSMSGMYQFNIKKI
jgi:hypothetical protein